MKVKAILIEATASGYGIVNYDGNQQKHIWCQIENVVKEYGKNTMFAKKNLYRDPSNDKLYYKIVVSSNCLRNAIFKYDVKIPSPNTQHDTDTLINYIASPYSTARGYLFLDRGFKRKSPVSVLDAEQTNDSVSNMVLCSKSGMKDKNENILKDNSLFYKETIGDIKYQTRMTIDLDEMMFFSFSDLFDRQALNPDYFDKFEKCLKARHPEFNSKLGYYLSKDTVQDIPEYGIVFNNEYLINVVKLFIKNVLSASIKRSGAMFQIDTVRIKYVYDPIEDRFNSNEGWIDIKSMEDIRKINFQSEDFYVEVDKEKAEKLINETNKNRELSDKKKIEKKTKEEEAKIKSKENKNNKK